MLKEYLDLNIKLVFVTAAEWKKYKLQYIENTKNNVQYKYIEESNIENNDKTKTIEDDSIKNENNEILEKVNQLFDLNKIEIKGE